MQNTYFAGIVEAESITSLLKGIDNNLSVNSILNNSGLRFGLFFDSKINGVK